MKDSPLRVVLDTNALLRTISRRSAYKNVLDSLYTTQYDLYLSTEILLEYEEKISDIFSPETAEFIIGAFSLLTNVKHTSIYFNLLLIGKDPDDNKFVDCAFAGNVHFLVTDDKHYNVLKTVTFPKISVVTLEEFSRILKNN